MYRVCLIIPPSPFLLDERVFPFLGTLKVAAAWEAQGVKVDVLDLGGIENYLDVVDVYLKDKAWNEVLFVGLTATTPQLPNACQIAQFIRDNYPEQMVILGGPHVTLMNTAANREKKKGIVNGRANKNIRTLLNKFEYLICGDGELTFDLILDCIQKGYTQDVIIDVDDRQSPYFLTDKSFSSLPNPARHLIDLDSYHYHIEGERATSLISQLGCPYQCFTGNTKIIVSNGPNKKAKNVNVGDKLIGFNEETKELTETEVVRKFEHITNEIYIIEFLDGTIIEATEEHPFYVNGEWKEVKYLRKGDEIYDITPNDKISLNKKLYNPAKHVEVRKKISNSVKKLFEDGILNSDHLKSENRTEEFKENIKKYWNTPQGKKRRNDIKQRMIEKNPMFDEGVRFKTTQTLKRKIANGDIIPFMCTPEYWEKLAISPNNHEQELLVDLLDEFGHRYEFVGDGSFRIGFYSPDFIDKQTKKIIEYNGCWWHGCSNCFPEKHNNRDIDRYKKFEQAGYKVFVIKSCEYKKDKNKVLAKLRSFTYNGKEIKSIKIEQRKEVVYNFECSPHHNFFAEYLLSHNCTFCSGRNSPFLRNIRNRDIPSIVKELEDIYLTYGYKAFMFYDDELNVNKEMIPLMYAIADLGQKHGVEWKLRGFTKSELFTEEQAKAMYEAGFRVLLTGFESGDPKILKNIRKRATRDDNTRCVEIAKKYGLKVKALMSMGHAGESFETIENTKKWLLEVQPDDFDCTVITTYPGSPYFDDAVLENGNYVFTSKDTGDKLYQDNLDYTQEVDYYKGIPGNYIAHVWTDYLSVEELAKARDDLESEVRRKLGIPYNPSNPAKKYEHSMGSSRNLPGWILRSTEESKTQETQKEKKHLKVI